MSQLLFTLAQQAPILLLLGTEKVIGFLTKVNVSGPLTNHMKIQIHIWNTYIQHLNHINKVNESKHLHMGSANYWDILCILRTGRAHKNNLIKS